MSLPLLVSKSSRRVDLDELSCCVTPDSTKTWFPVPHSAFVMDVRTTLQNHGFRIHEEAHSVSNNGATRYFGIMQVSKNGKSNTGHETLIGLRNSHDKSFSAGLICGSRVLVCDNLAFSGEVILRRRHTQGIFRELPWLISSAMGKLIRLSANQEAQFSRYETTPLTSKSVSSILIAALERGIIAGSRIPEILEEYRGGKGQGRLLELFNAFTHSLSRKISTADLAERTIPLHDLLSDRSLQSLAAIPWTPPYQSNQGE